MAFPDQRQERGSRPDPGSARLQPPASVQPESAQPAQLPEAAAEARRSGGAEGNERLTAATGAVLLILLAVECVTILRIGSLLTLHIFLGMMLLGPVALKTASVSYRYVRRLAGSTAYRRKGKQELLLRLTGPLIVASTGVLFGSGIMLTLTGDMSWLIVHQMSFVAWCCLMFIHVFAYAGRLPRLLAAEARGIANPEGGEGHARQAMRVLGGRGTRAALLIASLLAGLAIALLTRHAMSGFNLGLSVRGDLSRLRDRAPAVRTVPSAHERIPDATRNLRCRDRRRRSQRPDGRGLSRDGGAVGGGARAP